MTRLHRLMKRPADTDSEAWLRACIHATNALPVDASIKVDILGNLMILIGLGYVSETINRIFLQEGLVLWMPLCVNQRLPNTL